jgi:hypothetical protein
MPAERVKKMDASQTQTSGHKESDDVSYWLRVKREASVGSFQPLEDAAKQIVTITSLLQAGYFAAVSVSEVKKANNAADPWFVVFIIFSMLTVGIWIISLFYATRVFIPKVYNASSKELDVNEQVREIRIAYNKTSTYKYENLKIAVNLLRLSFIPFIMNIFIYLAMLKVPPPK